MDNNEITLNNTELEITEDTPSEKATIEKVDKRKILNERKLASLKKARESKAAKRKKRLEDKKKEE